jgi:hypothetical protein
MTRSATNGQDTVIDRCSGRFDELIGVKRITRFGQPLAARYRVSAFVVETSRVTRPTIDSLGLITNERVAPMSVQRRGQGCNKCSASFEMKREIRGGEG